MTTQITTPDDNMDFNLVDNPTYNPDDNLDDNPMTIPDDNIRKQHHLKTQMTT
jgi:hypothetical protein